MKKMKKLSILLTLTLLSVFSYSQKLVRHSIHCYEGEIKGTEIIWVSENLECHGYKIKITNKKIIITRGLKKQTFDILKSSGTERGDELVIDTWTCYDRMNKIKCYIYYAIPENEPNEEEIYIEYKKEVYCFRVIKNE